ncbi:MAG: hypothetical protein J7L55_02140 [Desulfurococcales archaeon]|nr:hypothetical protein [Desulfurococcales archaeon]
MEVEAGGGRRAGKSRDEEAVSRFVEKVVLELVPGIYLRLVSSVGDVGEEILKDPEGFYTLMESLLGGEEAMHFFDRMVALHVQSKTGVLPQEGVFTLLRVGRLSKFLNVVHTYLKALGWE